MDTRPELGRFVVELPTTSHQSTDVLLDRALDLELVVLELAPIFVARRGE